MVFFCLALNVFSTIENHEYEKEAEAALYNLEIVIVIWFGLEFCVRYVFAVCQTNSIFLIYLHRNLQLLLNSVPQ